MESQDFSVQIKDGKFKSLVRMYHRDGKKLLYDGKLCITRKSVPEITHIAHDSDISRRFGYFKTLSRLKNVYWKHKSRDVKKCVQGCIICQQKKDHQGKKFSDPTSLVSMELQLGWTESRRESIFYLRKNLIPL